MTELEKAVLVAKAQGIEEAIVEWEGWGRSQSSDFGVYLLNKAAALRKEAK